MLVLGGIAGSIGGRVGLGGFEGWMRILILMKLTTNLC